MPRLKTVFRCPWCLSSGLMIKYHDEEWGVPIHDERKLFEFIVLDTFQAGLSWSTILNKRENFRNAFDNFEPEKVARYSEKRTQRLLNDTGIIRNKLKIYGTVNNAKKFIEIQKEHGSFDKYILQFTNFKTIKKLPYFTGCLSYPLTRIRRRPEFKGVYGWLRKWLLLKYAND